MILPLPSLPVILLLLPLLTYLTLIHHLRYRRRHQIKHQFSPHRVSLQPRTRKSAHQTALAMMTADSAQHILHQLATLEYPRTYGLSIFFAIFSTYALPSVARTITSTGQLSAPSALGKRTADTSVLIQEMYLNPPSSARCRRAIARMNYLHSCCRAAGKITDEEMLYTLSLFALQPVNWTSRFEWRVMSDVEINAHGVLWKALGDAMDISFEALPGCDEGWRDGRHWLNEMREWSERYEAQNMVPSEEAAQLVDRLVRHALPALAGSKAFVSVAKQILNLHVGDRVGAAMRLPRPSWGVKVVFESVFWMRKMALRFLLPPRPAFLGKRWVQPNPDGSGRWNAEEWLAEPWYVRPTLWSRWSLAGLVRWAVGGTMPAWERKEFKPEGYLIEEMGPEFESGKGEEFMQKEEERMEGLGLGKCSPFHFDEEMLRAWFEGPGEEAEMDDE